MSVGLDILNGAVTIDRDGTISAKGSIKIDGDLQVEGAITMTATAGENIKAKDVLYVSAPGVVSKADANFEEKSIVVGVAARDAAKGSKVVIVIGGKAKGFNTLQTGKKYYLKPNGGLTHTLPLDVENAIPVGVAFSQNELIVQLGN